MYEITKAIIDKSSDLILSTDFHEPKYRYREGDALTIHRVSNGKNCRERHLVIRTRKNKGDIALNETILEWNVSVNEGIECSNSAIELETFIGSYEDCIEKGVLLIKQYCK